MPDAKAMKEYVAKHDLEKHVSQALNDAIRTWADDPIDHIAKYLISKAPPRRTIRRSTR